jgi:hypothetical protein
MYKNILFSVLVLLMIFSVSCEKDTNEIVTTPFDHDAQLIIDRDSINNYLNTHYYNTNDGRLWSVGFVGGDALPIEDQVPLKEDPKLDSIEGIKANGTLETYTMYYYIEEEGVDNGNIGFSSPSTVDSVFVKYSGMLLDSTVFDSREDYPVWFQLPNTIEGWGRGLPQFTRGTFETTEDEDFNFINPGRGYIIFPSGLGYMNGAVGGLPYTSNSCLIFRIELDDVNLIDTDLDGVPTKFEISFDAAGNITTYNTDGDNKDDFEDVDDDNDFVTTRDEVMNEFVTIGNPLDARGNIDFPYFIDPDTGETGKVILGMTSPIPNYKDFNKN